MNPRRRALRGRAPIGRSILRDWRTTPYRREALISTVTNAAMFALALLTGPVIARVLGPEGRGDVAAVVAPAAILTWLLSFGLPSAAAYFVDPVPEGRLLATTTVFGVVGAVPVCVALWFLCPAYLDGYSSASITWARIFLVYVPISVGTQAALEIRRRRAADVRWNCWRSAPMVVAAIGIVVLATLDRLTLAGAFASYFVGGLVPTVYLALRLVRLPDVRPSLETLQLMFPYAWRTLGTIVAASVTTRIDQAILVGFVGPGELGLYAIAVTAASVTSPFAAGVTQALFGHLRNESSPVIAAERFRRSLWATTVVSVMVAGGMALLAPMLLRIVFGQRFEGATAALRILLPGSVAYNMLTVIGTKLYSDGRPGDAARSAVLGGIVTVGGLVVAIPLTGIEGAALVTTVAFVVQVAYLVRRGALRPAPVTSGEPALPTDLILP